MQVAAMDHGVGIAEAGAEVLAEIDVADLASASESISRSWSI
jgi:hypothetical protein